MKYLRAYKDMEPTFGELAKGLTQLKFENRSNDELFLYYHKNTDTLVVLKKGKINDPINRARFAAISLNLEGMGVIEHIDDLGKMIEQARLKEQAAAA